MSDASNHIIAGYDSRIDQTSMERARAQKAGQWRFNPAMEQLIGREDIPSSLRLQLGFYLDDKAAAAEAGMDTNGGTR